MPPRMGALSAACCSLVVPPVLALFYTVSLVGAVPAFGQLASPRKATGRAANVRIGVLTAVDTNAASITLKPRSGADTLYRLTERTRLTRDRRPVDLAAFKPGETVVVRFRRSGVGPASLYDLADRPSWDWLQRIRQGILEVTVRAVEEESLRAGEAPGGPEIDYRLTERTALVRAGKTIAPTDLRPGERVWIASRQLPGGELAALAIADTAAGAALLVERGRSTVRGVVQSVDAGRRSLSLRTAAGDDRQIVLAPDCVVRYAARDVPFSVLRAGLTVSVRLQRGLEDDVQGVRVTVQAAKGGRRRPGPAAASPGGIGTTGAGRPARSAP